MADPTIPEVRDRVKQLRDKLPASIDIRELNVWSKAPYQLLSVHHALIWRTEELARNACDALEKEDFTVAAVLARAVTENAALLWKILELLETRDKYSPKDFSDLLLKALVGSKQWEEAPDPFNVLTCLDHMDKKIPGVRANYDSLSEMSHPNWSGVFGSYSTTDKEKYITHFGRGLRGADTRKNMITNSIMASLQLFESAYDRISEITITFIAELKKIDPDKK